MRLLLPFGVAVLSILSLPACTERSEGTGDAGIPTFDATGRDAEPAACAADRDCADRIACSVDHCVMGACVHDPCADCCEDGLVCNASLGCVDAPEPCTEDSECADAVRCTLDSCRDATFCDHAPQDGLCDPGEICLPAVGCIPEPPTSCTTAEDCEVGARCVGEWDCQDEFGCVFVSIVDCDDADACTVDGCDEERAGCFHDPLDADGDGDPPESCAGSDCDDDDADRHGDATEACDGAIDHDCDGTVDEGCCSMGPCTTTCGSTGVRDCTSGACVPPPETCGGGDEDCDGMTDEGCCTVGACTTTCGSTGARECPSGACVPPSEICNGLDDDCDGAADDGFECTGTASRGCTTGCGSMGTQTCSACTYGACVPPAEICNALDDDCAGGADDTFECVRGTTAPCPTTCGSTGTQTCRAGTCSYGTCAPPAETCNGADDDCDGARDDGVGTCYRGETQSCTLHGFFSGSTACRTDCSSFDLSTCTNCGNGVRNAGEACDGVDLGGATCTSIGMGFGSGTLRCAAGCMFDTSMCSRCGNGAIDAGEQCDGTALGGATCASIGMGFDSGTLRCGSTCRYDTTMCRAFNPTGTYTVSPNPTYTCAFTLVSFDLSPMSLSLAGTTMTLTLSGIPCSPSGIYNPAMRSFDLTCTEPGTCAETYRLTGMFTTDNTWSGTFRASFAGGGGACYDCTNQMWSVTGTR